MFNLTFEGRKIPWMLLDSGQGTEALGGSVARGGQTVKMENIKMSNVEEFPEHKIRNCLFL